MVTGSGEEEFPNKREILFLDLVTPDLESWEG